MHPQEHILDQLPLTEATFFILLSLSPGKKHGYAILKDVEELSDGRITLGTGTLYGALGRLLDQGWIQRVDEGQTAGRSRKAYVLSDLGRRILAAEAERLRSVVSTAHARLSGADL